MVERFTDHLRRVVDSIWEAQHAHPFVCGIGDGSLDLDKFRFWVRQDYLFLVDYCRVFALGVARAPDLATMGVLAELLHSTLKAEMDLHRSYAAEFGISHAELEAETKWPATQGYTDFLIRTAAVGDFAELAAALLPCMWGFSEVGRRLALGGRPEDPRYAKWIDVYSASDFAKLAEWCRGLVDRLAVDAGPDTRRRLEDAFVTSSRYELSFWTQAWEYSTGGWR
ncbi:MAG: thiaminase II [Chloroflexi bacterium]|nr:thiaminase II [Chloroflexota bacterium]